MTALAILTPLLPLFLTGPAILLEAGPWRRILPAIAALPALLFALTAPDGSSATLPPVLLGLDLGLDPLRRPLLLVTASLWFLAGVYAAGYMPRGPHAARFAIFFLLSMAGSLGLVICLDVPGFYFFFALMTLSSFILVIHDETRAAFRAGTVYIILSMIGETMVLLGFLRACAASGSREIALIPAAIASDPVTIALLTAGFAVKAGQVPLHVWLPLAHPAAPTPASAVLSGAMIKAGILGMALCLPLGHDLAPDLAPANILAPAIGFVGLFTAFYGAGVGMVQTNPKAVLAYSSLSQMGLIVSGIGLGLSAPDLAGPILTMVAVYAMHHGFAKAALFFAVGVVDRSAGMARTIAFVAAGLCAVSIAGAPLTAGAFAKDLLKDAAASGKDLWLGGLIYGALPFSALATSLLLIRFLLRLNMKAPGAGSSALLWVPFLAAAASAQLLPGLGLNAPAASLTLSGLWTSLWPLLAAAALAAAFVIRAERRGIPLHKDIPAIPEGDIVALAHHLPRLKQRKALYKDDTGLMARFGKPPSVLSLISTLEELARERNGAAFLFAFAALALALVFVLG